MVVGRKQTKGESPLPLFGTLVFPRRSRFVFGILSVTGKKRAELEMGEGKGRNNNMGRAEQGKGRQTPWRGETSFLPFARSALVFRVGDVLPFSFLLSEGLEEVLQ